MLVLLGATAGQSVLGPGFRLGAARGMLIDSELAGAVTATLHPSSILRAHDEREARRLELEDDLRFAAAQLA